jgi:hypothetical protein
MFFLPPFFGVWRKTRLSLWENNTKPKTILLFFFKEKKKINKKKIFFLNFFFIFSLDCFVFVARCVPMLHDTPRSLSWLPYF